jgi:DNA polymerase III epsilon subunit-like protein
LRSNQYCELEPNKNQRYRLPPETAKRLGLDVKSTNRYTLHKELEAKLFGYDQEKIKRLFFDIETSPMIVYSWRIGWKLTIGSDNIIEDWKIICISYKWEDEDDVHTLRWNNKCDKQLLIDFIKIANQADEMIAHNGDRFDIKKIRTRCIFHRIPMFPDYKTLDTLKKAKAGFNFNSNRLDYIAKFLGVGAKIEHEGFNMWVKCMQGDQQALNDMVRYCEGDIIVLEDVFIVMQNYIRNNTHTGSHNGKLKASCPNCGSEDVALLKNEITAMGTIKRRIECSPCGYVYQISNSAWRTFLEMKSNL